MRKAVPRWLTQASMNCFLFDGGPRSKWPAEMGMGDGDDSDSEGDLGVVADQYEARLPEGATVAATRRAILSVHPVLERAWGRRLGYRLMFKEIMLRVLTELAALGVPALCLHDGLIVSVADRDVAMRSMATNALRLTGIEFPVADKP